MTRERLVKNLILFIFILGTAAQVVGEVFIVPKPKEVSNQSDSFKLDNTIGIIIATNDTIGVMLGINQLMAEMRRFNGPQLIIDGQKDQVLHIGIPAQDEAFVELCNQRGVLPENRIGDEGYVLDIGPEKIIVAANTKSGIFYGIQSLKQIIRGSENKGEIPCMRIVDWPDLDFRAVQDDISRGPIPTLDFMKSQVRRLSELKINGLSYYIEHVVKTKSHGDFSPASGISACQRQAPLFLKPGGNCAGNRPS